MPRHRIPYLLAACDCMLLEMKKDGQTSYLRIDPIFHAIGLGVRLSIPVYELGVKVTKGHFGGLSKKLARHGVLSRRAIENKLIAILRAKCFRRVHHRYESRFYFLPSASFQSAIWVYP
jgi:hypothetical protein